MLIVLAIFSLICKNVQLRKYDFTIPDIPSELLQNGIIYWSCNLFHALTPIES